MKKFLLPLSIIIISIIISISFYLIKAPSSKKYIQKSKRYERKDNVSIIKSELQKQSIYFTGYGTIEAQNTTIISSQVKGKVIWKNPDFEIGSRFSKDKILIKIERIDYNLAIIQKKAQVKSAELAYRKEQAQMQIANLEWKYLDEKIKKKSNFKDLALRISQLEEKKMALNAAKANLEKAQLDLTKTDIKLPYNGVIISENIGIGQLVNNGTNILTVIQENKFQIIVSILQDELKFILPINQNSQAIIKDYITKDITLLPNLDNKTKMAQLIIKFSPTSKIDEKNSFFLNEYFKVKLLSKIIKSHKLPTHLIRENSTIWVIKNNKLKIQPINILFRQSNNTYFTTDKEIKNLEVIENYLKNFYEGMPLIRDKK